MRGAAPARSSPESKPLVSIRSIARDLFAWDGTVGRGGYAATGAALCMLKLALDHTVAAVAFQRSWSAWNYLIPSPAYSLRWIPPADAAFYQTMLLIAMPFVWIGVVMTVKRLRDVGLPIALFLLFFVPVVNLLFFGVLSVLPGRGPLGATAAPGFPARPPAAEEEGVIPTFTYAIPPSRVMLGLERLIPHGVFGAAAVALLAPLPFALALTIVGVNLLKNYGWGLFVGLPFAQSFATSILFAYRYPARRAVCATVGFVAILVWAGVLLAFGMEGMLCVLMAAPLLVLPAALGSILAAAVVGVVRDARRQVSSTLPTLFIGVIVVQGVERATRAPPELRSVRTAVVIAASPQEVWPNVVDFPSLSPPREWLFRAGIAYPTSARIEGRGVGAVRRCVFDTGEFVEPIRAWDAPRRLAFDVTGQAPPMQEWSPYGAIQTPHLAGFMRSHAGEFLLTPTADGGTRLEGTTWYTNAMWPACYWNWWSDRIVGAIHRRVLEHVERLTLEGMAASARPLDSGDSRRAAGGGEPDRHGGH